MCKYWTFIKNNCKIFSLFLLAFFVSTILSVTANPNTIQLVENAQNHYDQGQYQQAVEELQQAIEAFTTQDNRLNQAISLSNLSLAYQQLGNWQEAEKSSLKSLQLLKFTPNSSLPNLSSTELNILASALNIYGRLWYLKGKPEIALENWQKTTEIYQKLNNNTATVNSLINEVQALQSLGLSEQAKVTIEQVQQLLPSLPIEAQIQGWRSLGEVLQSVGNLEESQHYLKESLTLAQQSNSPEQISATLLSLGNTLAALGNLERDRKDTFSSYQITHWQCLSYTVPDTALAYYQQSSQAYQQASQLLPTSAIAIKAQINNVNILIKTKQLSSAQTAWKNINLSDLPPSRTAVYAKINLAHNLSCLRQQLPTAISPTWQDIEQLLTTATKEAQTLEDNQALSYALGSRGSLYEYFNLQKPDSQYNKIAQQLTEKALLLAQSSPSIAYQWQWQLGRLWKEQGTRDKAIIAYQNAIATLETVRQDLLTINTDVQFSFRDNVEPLYRQLVDFLLQPSTLNQTNLVAAVNLIDSLQLAELENFLGCNLKTLAQEKSSFDTVTETAFIYPILLDDRLVVIVKLPQQPIAYHVISIRQNEVENTVRKLRQAIARRNPENFRETSQTVYKWLIEPLEASLNKNPSIKTLVFVLDSYLRNIPMGVLYDGKEYLVEKPYALAVLPSSSLFTLKSPVKQLKILAAGVSQAQEVENRKFTAINVKDELDTLKTITTTKTLLDDQFTPNNLQKQLDRSNYSVLHLATHGNFSSNPQQTYLLAYEKLLRANDLYSLLQSNNTNINLLVLSACQTASGDNRATLGLAGLAVRAGAQSTLATLWQVSDRFTIKLIKAFYQSLSQGATKAEALHLAQKSLIYDNIDGETYQNDPYDWGAYILVGNWL